MLRIGRGSDLANKDFRGRSEMTLSGLQRLQYFEVLEVENIKHCSNDRVMKKVARVIFSRGTQPHQDSGIGTGLA
jgi:hypothetical protein